MKKFLIVALLAASAGTARAQIPTTDVAHIAADEAGLLMTLAEWGKSAASWAKQAADMAGQAKAWMQQAQDMKAQFDAISGVRNLGNIFDDPALRLSLPDDWGSVYDSAGDAMKIGDVAKRLAGLRSMAAKVSAAEALVGSIDSDLARVAQRASDMSVSNKAVGQNAYSKQPALLGQIESLMGKINETTDPKGIAELQARIGAEQAAQSWQTNNILLATQLQQSERDLAREQRQALAGKILGGASTSMPSIGE